MKINPKIKSLALVVASVGLFAACSGGGDDNSPNQNNNSAVRVLKGKVASQSANRALVSQLKAMVDEGELEDFDDSAFEGQFDDESDPTQEDQQAQDDQNAEAGDCFADGVIALDAKGNSKKTAVDNACDFNLELDTGKAYAINFTRGEKFVASLIFDRGFGNEKGKTFYLSSATEELDLGNITFVDGDASPQNNPLDANDWDGDGESDLVDLDDDGDQIEDMREYDCGYDGFYDDECEYNEDEVNVLRVFPADGEENVDLDSGLVIALPCEVDESILSESAFFEIASDSGDLPLCSGYLEVEDGITYIDCAVAEGWQPSTTYSVALGGFSCSVDGEVYEIDDAIEWSFSTAEVALNYYNSFHDDEFVDDYSEYGFE